MGRFEIKMVLEKYIAAGRDIDNLGLIAQKELVGKKIVDVSVETYYDFKGERTYAMQITYEDSAANTNKQFDEGRKLRVVG